MDADKSICGRSVAYTRQLFAGSLASSYSSSLYVLLCDMCQILSEWGAKLDYVRLYDDQHPASKLVYVLVSSALRCAWLLTAPSSNVYAVAPTSSVYTFFSVFFCVSVIVLSRSRTAEMSRCFSCYSTMNLTREQQDVKRNSWTSCSSYTADVVHQQSAALAVA